MGEPAVPLGPRGGIIYQFAKPYPLIFRAWLADTAP